VRVALIDGQWVAFPKHSQLDRAVFDMVVAGRLITENGVEDVAIMMVEAEATARTIDLIADGGIAPTEEVVAQGLEASKPFIKALCEAQMEVASKAAKATGDFPIFLEYQEDTYEAVSNAVTAELAKAMTIAGKQERETEIDRIKREQEDESKAAEEERRREEEKKEQEKEKQEQEQREKEEKEKMNPQSHKRLV
jgi:polyribonucleotide nucleotidyltransferase